MGSRSSPFAQQQARSWLSMSGLPRGSPALEFCSTTPSHYKCSRLQAQPNIDAFQFQHHKTRQQAKPRILRLLDLEFLSKGTNLVSIGNPDLRHCESPHQPSENRRDCPSSFRVRGRRMRFLVLLAAFRTASVRKASSGISHGAHSTACTAGITFSSIMRRTLVVLTPNR
jgi:hypothetical protein